MLLPKTNSFITKNVTSPNNEEIVNTVKGFLNKHANIIKIYVSLKVYENLHLHEVSGIPVCPGSGMSDKEITFVS